MKMPRRVTINIHYKITLIFGIITACILLGVYVYLNNSLREHTYQRIKTNLHKQTILARSYLKVHDEQSFESYQLDTVADRVGEDLGVRATIIDLDGTVLGDSELDDKALLDVENHFYRPEIQQARQSGFGVSRRFSNTIGKDMLYVAIPYGKEEVEGVIRLSIPLKEVDLISNRLKKTLIISLCIAFLFAMLISFLVSIFISRPIREMAWVAQGIGRGDLSRRVVVSSRDELGNLAEAFNYMSEQIKFRIDEVLRNKSRLEAVLLSMFEGVVVVDSNSTIVLMNQALRDFLYIQENPVGKRLLEAIRNVEIQEIVDSTLKLQKGVTSREISLVFPEERILLVHGTPVIRENTVEGGVFVFHDITELRKLEKIRQDFVANVSHELRTPISSIKGYAETLLEGALNEKKTAKSFLEIIHLDANRLAQLIDDLLDLSKIESGKLSLELKPCSITSIVDKVLVRLKRSIKDKSIVIHKDIPRALPNVLADEAGIIQVLFNLIDNAIKYNRQKGEITIQARSKDVFVQVDISDTGVGIPEKDLPRIYERFYRVDKARSRELGGTGLGLSIVKHIVQAHQGEVNVHSILGQGSTFSFTIPSVSQQ
jgi:two-component system phosphate regulon sensor histidine kinase PhoR